MKQVIIKGGQSVVEEVPAPQVEPGRVLVRVDHSCISIGTEMSGVRSSGTPLWKRAMQQPEHVKRVVQMVRDQGLARTKSLIEGKLAAGNPTGYSAAGVVIEVGVGIDDLKPGDKVACAGAQCAHHAEIICVPRNLAVKVPGELELSYASTVTLGAIAMQGVRRASPTLGESFVVIGLGVLGQLAVQLLKANGCRVIGVDLDKKRMKLAEEHGMNAGVYPEDGSSIEHVIRLTDGIGADGVIITAATPSDQVVSTAFQMCRKKGRVVLVGDVGLNLNRADFYQKELDFFISSSYGPGRYDDRYEEEGVDYPISYVRWTENRNMAEFIHLLSERKVIVDRLIHKVYPIDQATQAYGELKDSPDKPLMVLLHYPDQGQATSIVRTYNNQHALPAKSGLIKVAVAGAGGFAKGMHLPNIQKLNKLYHTRAIMSRTGHNATSTAKQFGADYASTDYEEVLKDQQVELVIVSTRHNHHASMALQALHAGKHVLVEKPTALNESELSEIEAFYQQNPRGPILLTGYNRRFSPHMRRVAEIVKTRSNPMIINYRMNVGYVPLDHWVHQAEGGGRNIGEACHIYDLFTYLTNSRVVKVDAHSITPNTAHYSSTDNFTATISFEDGSVATLTYTALGSKDYPKEQMELFVDGKVLEMLDYRILKVHGAKVSGIDGKLINKGQMEEMQAFATAIREGGEWPIPLWQQLQTMNIAFKVESKIRR